jgi:hypothetical protein
LCTSLIYRDLQKNTFGVGFNRDESVKRKPSLHPKKVQFNGIEYLCPIDGDYGGTWIGINSNRVVYAILNLYEAQLKIIKNPTSRGFLTQRLLREEIDFNFFINDNLSSYYPFRILKVGLEKTEVLSWDGERVIIETDTSKWKIIASSFMLGAKAEEIRSSVFHYNFLLDDGSQNFIDISSKYFSSHLPDKGGSSPCMHRREAHTVSNTIISIENHEIKLLYKNIQPCETEVYDIYKF